MANREPELLQILKERGPISVKRLRALTGLKKSCVNGALHGSKKTAKIETDVRRRPLWSYSETPIRPVKILRKKHDTDNESDTAE
jgi:predicted transcriptional regulator